ncbi:MAG TPA: hypothetical protein VF328_16175 [Mycobacterium sp.]|jgi:hypothetical protein
MAEAGLFIGWGVPVRGREKRALDLFNGTMQYYGRLQQDGKIERFDVAVLAPHGSDLAGFALMQGTEQQIDSLRRDEEFQQWVTRAQLIVEQFGVVDALVDQGLGQAISRYQNELGQLD